MRIFWEKYDVAIAKIFKRNSKILLLNGFLFVLLSTIITYFAIHGALYLVEIVSSKATSKDFTSIWMVFALIVVSLAISKTLSTTEGRTLKTKPKIPDWAWALFIMIVFITLTFVILGLFIYWLTDPISNKLSVKILVGFVGILVGSLYYIKNKAKFTKPLEKISYWSMVFLTPAGFVELFM